MIQNILLKISVPVLILVIYRIRHLIFMVLMVMKQFITNHGQMILTPLIKPGCSINISEISSGPSLISREKQELKT